MMWTTSAFEFVPCCPDQHSGWALPLRWGFGLVSQRWGWNQYQWCSERRERREGSALLGGCLKLAGWRESGGQVLDKNSHKECVRSHHTSMQCCFIVQTLVETYSEMGNSNIVSKPFSAVYLLLLQRGG